MEHQPLPHQYPNEIESLVDNAEKTKRDVHPQTEIGAD